VCQYTDIGHESPDDIIWILRGTKLECSKRITSSGQAEPWTHWLLWGGVKDECWRGRFEPSTGYCSIVAPTEQTGRRPPSSLLKTLQTSFAVKKFYFFRQPNGEAETIPPSPRKEGDWVGRAG
jgi:hypothetical protein